VEGGGQGFAGGLIFICGVEGVEVALGVLHALQLPEDLGDLGDDEVLHGGAGAEVGFHFSAEDFVGGIALGGEQGSVGAAVFAGVLGDGFFSVFGAGAGGFAGVGTVGG
jgi:hypothetical protein